MVACLYGGSRLYFSWTRPNSDSETRVSVEIPKGASLSKIAHILEDKEIIRDAWSFEMYSRWNKLATAYQAGDYIFLRNLTFPEVADQLQNGKSEEIRVTIPEGSTIAQIDEILARKNLIVAGEFTRCTTYCDLGFRISSLEGYLFPSTYFVNPNTFSSKNFVQRLYNTFQSQLNPLRKDLQQSGRTLNEVVIVASMIEREAFGDSLDEKKKIANVIWKRYDEGIHLGIDATTRYELNRWKGALYAEDFESDSPYNTRRKLGLPPTAISNPGIESIKAAVYPEDTEYYYYLHDSKGQIHFGRTLEEHNENKRLYIWGFPF
ncbi:endolytic transglycosylase MltG [Candidatus Gracilibacteria bacterium]|nr:endolytic transglycosylase MltG [Candidatus Gracilibacteria bacterium]